MSWADLGNQTAAVVQMPAWTAHNEIRAAVIVTIHTFLSSYCSEWMFLFVVSVTPAVLCFPDLIAGPASPGLMLNTAAVWQWGMKPESGAAGWAAATFCMRLSCDSKKPVHRRVLNVMTMLWKYWFTKAVFQCPEKVTLKLEVKREPCSSQAHPGGKRFMTMLGSRNAGTEIGFFLMRVRDQVEFLTWASRWFRCPNMLCDFGWHSPSANSGSLWLYDLSQHGDTAVSRLFWLPLPACWSWHMFQPWCVKVCAMLNRLQLRVTSLLPLTVKTVTDLKTAIFTGRSFQRDTVIDQEHWILNKLDFFFFSILEKLILFCDLYSDIAIHQDVTHIGTD